MQLQLTNLTLYAAAAFVCTLLLIAGGVFAHGLATLDQTLIELGMGGLLAFGVLYFAAAPAIYRQLYLRHGPGLPTTTADAIPVSIKSPPTATAATAAWLYPGMHIDLGLLAAAWFLWIVTGVIDDAGADDEEHSRHVPWWMLLAQIVFQAFGILVGVLEALLRNYISVEGVALALAYMPAVAVPGNAVLIAREGLVGYFLRSAIFFLTFIAADVSNKTSAVARGSDRQLDLMRDRRRVILQSAWVLWMPLPTLIVGLCGLIVGGGFVALILVADAARREEQRGSAMADKITGPSIAKGPLHFAQTNTGYVTEHEENSSRKNRADRVEPYQHVPIITRGRQTKGVPT